MLTKLKENPNRSFVLFPSVDSISVPEFIKKVQETMPSSSESKGKEKEESQSVVDKLSNLQISNLPPLNIVIIDGTWNQVSF